MDIIILQSYKKYKSILFLLCEFFVKQSKEVSKAVRKRFYTTAIKHCNELLFFTVYLFVIMVTLQPVVIDSLFGLG